MCFQKKKVYTLSNKNVAGNAEVFCIFEYVTWFLAFLPAVRALMPYG